MPVGAVDSLIQSPFGQVSGAGLVRVQDEAFKSLFDPLAPAAAGPIGMRQQSLHEVAASADSASDRPVHRFSNDGEFAAAGGPGLEAAQQLVSSAFILPMLQQLRTDPLRSDLFHGGSAEDLFGQKLDTIIADNIVRRADFPLARAIYDRITRRAPAGRSVNVDG